MATEEARPRLRPLLLAAAALLPACGKEKPGDAGPVPPPLAYEDALSSLVRDLEGRVLPIALPPLAGDEAVELSDLVEVYAYSGGLRLGRAAREDLFQRGAKGLAALHAYASDRGRETRARVAAADLLGEWKETGEADLAAEAAIRLAQGADEAVVRAAAARAAGALGRRFAIARLVLRLKYEKSDLAALHVAAALVRLENFSGLLAAREVLDRGTVGDAFEVAREMAILCGAPLLDDAPPDRIYSALSDEHLRWLREGVSRGNPPPFDDRLRLELALFAARLGDADLRLVDDARFVLARGGREGVGVLLPALRDRSPFARVRAMEVLGALGPVASPAVEDLLRLRLEAAHRSEPLLALGAIGDRRATPALLAALDEADPDVRVAAARGLLALRDPSSLPALKRTLAANEPGKPGALPDLALLTAQALAELDDFSGVRILVALLDGAAERDALGRALDAAFRRMRENRLDDAGYEQARTPEEKAAAARRWVAAHPGG